METLLQVKPLRAREWYNGLRQAWYFSGITDAATNAEFAAMVDEAFAEGDAE